MAKGFNCASILPAETRRRARPPRCCCAVFLLALLAIIEPAAAQVETNALSQLKEKLAQPNLSSNERNAALDQLLQTRQMMIAQNPNDPQRAVRLTDQASDIFFEGFQQEALALTVLFGAPSEAQHRRACQLAQQMHDAATAAEQSIADAILNVETKPAFQTDAELQQRHRNLIEVQRDRRIPFLRGISAILHASLNVTQASEQQTLFALAERVLAPLTESLDGSLAIEARLYDGLAKAQTGKFDAAEAMLAQVTRDSAATPAQIFAARMGGALNRSIHDGPQAGIDALASIESRYADRANDGAELFFRVLIADQRFILHRQLALQAPTDDRPALFAHAFEAYTNLLKTDLGNARDAGRTIIFARLCHAIASHGDELPPMEQLPGLVTVAYAEQLAQDPRTRDRAIELLETALQQNRLDNDAAPAALFTLGRALHEAGHQLFAVHRFIDLASKYAADPQAPRAIQAAASIAHDLHQGSPQDREAADALRQSLALLIERYPNLPAIDAYRFDAARLALEENRFDDAEAFLRQITPDAPQWADAHFTQAAVARARAANAADDSARRPLSQTVIEVIDRVQPVLEHSMAGAHDPKRLQTIRDYLGMLRVYRAEAQLGLRQPQLALSALAPDGSPDLGRSSDAVRAEALRVRFAANQMLGRPEQSLAEIEQFAHQSPERAGALFSPMMQSIQRDVEISVSQGRDDDARALAQRMLLPIAQLSENWLKQPGAASPEIPPRLKSQIADAYRLSGEFSDALAKYESLLRDHPDARDLLLGKAECLFGLGGEQRLADVMNIYKRLASASDPNSSTAMADAYWLAQVRMLQILDRVDRHTDEILPRIERLRQQDHELGGERFRREFETLRRKHSPSS